jgi:hypothetical protein
MWATLAIAAALSLAPNQKGELKLTNQRATYGFLGETREKNQYLPGDVVFVAFDIDGLTIGKDGKISYSMEMKLKNAKGEALFSQVPQPIEANNTLGGSSTRGFSYAQIGNDLPAGKYTMTVAVKDEQSQSGKPVTLTQNFEVTKRDFGIVRLGLFYDDQGKEFAPPMFVVGQHAWIHFMTTGFDRGKDKSADIEVNVRVLDANGKPTLAQAFTGSTKTQNVPPTVQTLPWWQKIELNRAGKYKLELEATDKSSNKKVKEVLNVTVVDSK